MKEILLSTVLSITLLSPGWARPLQGVLPDSLPKVFNDETDVLHARYRHLALNRSKAHQLPGNLAAWKEQRKRLRENVIARTGVKFYESLPFNLKETGKYQGNGYTVKNVYFQTRPDVYATANLYEPEGKGPFPAVVMMMGHSRDGKLYEPYQLVGQSLAREGYVALCIDPWGAGERGTVHGEFEYHGAALGASLLNIGETLMGMQLTDNIRAVDLLRSLPNVDRDKIGATGASGGGNQTMWLAAIDERVKAAMPVVSVGTFDSYIMAHNCVCEVLPKGLTFTEEWGVLGLVAPRAIKMCNHNQESNPTFYPAEMKKSLAKAQPVFDWYGVGKNIGYELYDHPHGYFAEDREALLGWMDFHLKGKGDGRPRKEQQVSALPAGQLMVFQDGKRDPKVQSTESYSRWAGSELKKKLMAESAINAAKKRSDLSALLGISGKPAIAVSQKAGETDGWSRVILETGDERLLPVLLRKGKNKEFVVVAHAEGKSAIPASGLSLLMKSGSGIAVIDFSGTGEAFSKSSNGFDNLSRLHTYGRAALWLGGTVMGNWADELATVADWLRKEQGAAGVSFHGYKEAGLAGIFHAATGGKLKEVHTYGSPASYVFDSGKGIEHFGVGVHVPGILQWGDLSLAAALGQSPVFLHNPVTLSGRALSSPEKEEAQKEYAAMRTKTGGGAKVVID
ncbi:dienelactone hydrolase family protein [Ravibacter arvi]|uniref:dienelactone hydrolase family protein n=1 Tax=Ravibacter arvi TaxID=2051041 RepID=UPI0031EFAE00